MNCIQKEYTLQDPYTLIAAVFPWSGNEEICISKMFDPCTSFALSLETDRELEMLMDYIVMKNLIFDFQLILSQLIMLKLSLTFAIPTDSYTDSREKVKIVSIYNFLHEARYE